MKNLKVLLHFMTRVSAIININLLKIGSRIVTKIFESAWITIHILLN